MLLASFALLEFADAAPFCCQRGSWPNAGYNCYRNDGVTIAPYTPPATDTLRQTHTQANLKVQGGFPQFLTKTLFGGSWNAGTLKCCVNACCHTSASDNNPHITVKCRGNALPVTPGLWPVDGHFNCDGTYSLGGPGGYNADAGNGGYAALTTWLNNPNLVRRLVVLIEDYQEKYPSSGPSADIEDEFERRTWWTKFKKMMSKVMREEESDEDDGQEPEGLRTARAELKGDSDACEDTSDDPPAWYAASTRSLAKRLSAQVD